MLNDAIHSFATVGLRLNVAKIKWIADKHSKHAQDATLRLGRLLIPVSDSLAVLGCVIFADGKEGHALRHRM